MSPFQLNHFQFAEIIAVDGRTMVVEDQIRHSLTVHLNVLLDYLNAYAAACLRGCYQSQHVSSASSSLTGLHSLSVPWTQISRAFLSPTVEAVKGCGNRRLKRSLGISGYLFLTTQVQMLTWHFRASGLWDAPTRPHVVNADSTAWRLCVTRCTKSHGASDYLSGFTVTYLFRLNIIILSYLLYRYTMITR
jgi:hypothetical protein